MPESSEDESSPKNRFKFLCSYGGKILPRPSDGQLKYIGGNTRVLSVPRSITFSEMMDKVKEMYQGEAVMKYQLITEDLDVLVSVTCDEDLRHMLDEYDRHDHPSSTSPRLRVFLFPTRPITGTHSASSPLEQRYIDAINGIPLLPAPTSVAASAAGRSMFTLSSPTTMSPNSSLDASAATALSQEVQLNARLAGLSGGMGMHRVRSTPIMSNLQSQNKIHGLLYNDSREFEHQKKSRFDFDLGANGNSVTSPRFNQHQKPPFLQKQHSVNYGHYPGPLSSQWRSGSVAHASVLHKMSFQSQHQRPYYHVAPQSNSLYMGIGGGYSSSGQSEEAFVPPRFRHCPSRYGSPPNQ